MSHERPRCDGRAGNCVSTASNQLRLDDDWLKEDFESVPPSA